MNGPFLFLLWAFLPLFYGAFNLVYRRFSHCRRGVIDGGHPALVNGRF